MSALRAVLVAFLVAAGLAVPLLAVPTAAVYGDPIQPATRTLQADEANNTSQAPIGQQISGFMQEQTSQADGAVESGMWSAAYENAGDGSRKAALVNQRTEGLAGEVASIQAERRELIEARRAGNITALEFRSRMNGLAGRYASLMTALEETEPRTEEVGGNVSTIQEIRGAATQAVGPAVVATAGNVSVSPPGLSNNTTLGTPVAVPGQGNGTEIGDGVAGDRPISDGPNGNGSEDGSGIDIGNGTVGVGDGNDGNGNERNGNGDEGVGNGIGGGFGVEIGFTFDLPNPLADPS